MPSTLLSTVVPALGALVSLGMYAAPVKAVQRAAHNKNLGDLNAVPFAVTVANTIAWLTYGLLKKDAFIVTPNAPGVLIAMYCTVTALGLADERVRGSLRAILCGVAAALPALGVLTAFACTTLESRLSLWGISANLITMVYYGAPLSTMAEVVRMRNSSSILLPLTLMNLTNAALWTTYGVAIGDLYVWAPNGVGVFLSSCQLALATMYPARGQGGLPTSAAGGSYTRMGASDDHDAGEAPTIGRQ